MSGEWCTVETDVLVVGGGSAGCMAAIKAKDADPSLEVTVMEKGALSSGGAIARGMDALNIVAVPGVSTPE
ncbi:MAG: FAD-binding protein [Candidatus Bathyarchaeia archaeon]